MNIQVLWIDDQWKDQPDFIADAEFENIDVTPAESHEEGMNELNGKEDFFDAVILDAKVKDAKDSTVTNLIGLKNSRDKLIELNKEIYLPFFIFTGQPDYANNDIFEQSFGKYYLKGQDNNKLLEDIRINVALKPERQFRLKFSEAFHCFDLGILNQNAKRLLIANLENLEKEDFRKKNINVQRDMLEAIFIGLNKPIPCIPNEFFNNNAPIQECCVRFLENRPTNNNKRRTDSDFFESTLTVQLPQDIKSAIRKLKESTNGYSHLHENDMAKYPFLANTFLILELLEWLPKFVEVNYKNYI